MHSRVGATFQLNRWTIRTGMAGKAHKFLTKEDALCANDHALADALWAAVKVEQDPRLIYWLMGLAVANLDSICPTWVTGEKSHKNMQEQMISMDCRC